MSKYFKTSDGEEFYTENHAQTHARSLDDKTVTPPSISDEVIAKMEVVAEEVITEEVITEEVAAEESPVAEDKLEPKKKK
jgi:hypothetical protein